MTNPFDLTQRPPRSPRVRLGGYALLPRMLDKCRAVIAGTAGDYKYACPMDQHLLQFAGVDPEALKVEVAKGLGDGALLTWVRSHARNARNATEIAAWSVWMETYTPGDLEAREFFHGLHRTAGPERDDIVSWFDVLDLDDFVSFGGKA